MKNTDSESVVVVVVDPERERPGSVEKVTGTLDLNQTG